MSSKERRDDSFIKKPIYPGGQSALRKFIKDNLKYPQTALANKIEGTVFLKYTINHKGKVIETKVLKGIGHGCDAEASRILELLQFEVPKNPRKLRVLFHNKTQITFRLPKSQKATPKPPAQPAAHATASRPVATQARYVYKPSAKKTTPEKTKPKKVYSYTISGNFQ